MPHRPPAAVGCAAIGCNAGYLGALSSVVARTQPIDRTQHTHRCLQPRNSEAPPSLLQAFSDGAALAVFFQAVQVLSAPRSRNRSTGPATRFSAGCLGRSRCWRPCRQQRECGLLLSPLHGIGEDAHPQPGAEFQFSLRLLHSSGQLDAADAHLRDRMHELEDVRRAQTRRVSLVGPIAGLLPILAIALIAAFSLLLFGGRSTGVLPSLVTFVLALQRLNQRISGIAGTFNSLANNSGKLERLNKILSPDGKQFRRLGGTPFATLERGIRFEDVCLQYAPELPPALSDISFTLPKGQMLALVGPSGAGKSSIADLLTGLYAPTAGQIWVDDRPLEQLELAGWQQRLGVVSQDTFLFNASIADNIAFGR